MTNRSSEGLDTSLHPIQVVARRTGLSVDVIRAWEKRYAVVTPARSGTGRRGYSDADVRRLQLLAQATLGGRTIGQVAALDTPALAALVAADEAGDGAARPAPHAVPPAHDDHASACLAAAERFDGIALDGALRRAVIALGAERFLDQVAVPFAGRLSARGDAALAAPHRHLALTLLRRTLHRIAEVAMTPLAAPDVVVTTPAGQPEELGALLAAAAAAAQGWRVTYVGPGLPAEDIAETAVHAGARLVAVSVGAAGDRAIPRELRRLRELLPPDVAIVVEGAAAGAHAAAIRDTGAAVVHDLTELRARLRALRGA